MLIRRQLGDRFVDSTRRGTVILINVISPCKKCDELIAMPVAGERRKNLTALVYWIACNINTRESIATFHREAIISRFIFVAPVKSGRSIVDSSILLRLIDSQLSERKKNPRIYSFNYLNRAVSLK